MFKQTQAKVTLQGAVRDEVLRLMLTVHQPLVNAVPMEIVVPLDARRVLVDDTRNVQGAARKPAKHRFLLTHDVCACLYIWILNEPTAP